MQILHSVQLLAHHTTLQQRKCRQKPGVEIPAGSSPAKFVLYSRVKFFQRNSRFRVRLVFCQARVDQFLLLVSQWIVLIEPAIAVHLGQLDADFLSLVFGELGQFLQNLGFAHNRNLVGRPDIVRMKFDSPATFSVSKGRFNDSTLQRFTSPKVEC